jgi:aspartate/methionine/tyrosine aminotransferase
MCDVYEHGVSLGVLSKAYGLAGLRVGWLAARDHTLLERAAEVKDYTTICVPAPSEQLACAALRASRTILTRNASIVRANLALWEEFVDEYRDLLEVVPPRAGPVAFPRVPLRRDVNAFCDEVLDQAGVLLLPGTVFDASSDAFRVGFGRLDFPAALDRFRSYLERTLRHAAPTTQFGAMRQPARPA